MARALIHSSSKFAHKSEAVSSAWLRRNARACRPWRAFQFANKVCKTLLQKGRSLCDPMEAHHWTSNLAFLVFILLQPLQPSCGQSCRLNKSPVDIPVLWNSFKLVWLDINWTRLAVFCSNKCLRFPLWRREEFFILWICYDLLLAACLTFLNTVAEAGSVLFLSVVCLWQPALLASKVWVVRMTSRACIILLCTLLNYEALKCWIVFVQRVQHIYWHIFRTRFQVGKSLSFGRASPGPRGHVLEIHILQAAFYPASFLLKAFGELLKRDTLSVMGWDAPWMHGWSWMASCD